jgi:hypothetical protein
VCDVGVRVHAIYIEREGGERACVCMCVRTQDTVIERVRAREREHMCVCVCVHKIETESMCYSEYESQIIVMNRTRRWQ